MGIEWGGPDDDPEARDRSARMVAVSLCVVGLALLFGLVALLDRHDAVARGDVGGARAVASTTTVTSGTSSTTSTGSSTSTAATTTTTAVPGTAVPTNSAVPTTEVPTTEPPAVDVAPGWVRYASPTGEFTAVLPGEPAVTHDLVASSGAPRTEYSVPGPSGSTITIDVTPGSVVADPDPVLRSVIDSARVQLGGTSVVSDAAFDVPGGRAQDASITVRGGEVRVRVESAGASLHVITMAIPEAATLDVRPRHRRVSRHNVNG